MGQPNAMPLARGGREQVACGRCGRSSASAGRSSRSCSARSTSTSSAACSSPGASTARCPSGSASVNERLRAPLNAILVTLCVALVFLFFQSYKDLPTFLATTDHKLNLAGTAWFSIVMAIFTWTLPGLNAILVRFRRPDLVRNAPYRKHLSWIGALWLVFPLWIYIFAVFKPIDQRNS